MVSAKFNKLYNGLSLILVTSLLITGCNKIENNKAKTSTTSTDVTASSTIPQGPTVTVAIDTSYPPYDFQGEKGEAVGFDVDILNAIGEKQGFKPNFLPKAWDGLEDNLAGKGDFNIIMSAVTLNDERKQKFEVSDVYAYGQDAIMTKPELTTINKFDDLKNIKVATQAETASADDLIKLQGKNNPNTILEKTTFLAFKDLLSGKVDAVLGDGGVLRYHAKSAPNMEFRFANEGEYFVPYEMVILGKKGDRITIDKFNAGLKQIVADGTYAKIYEKWFGEAPKPEQIPHGTLDAGSSASATASTTQ